MINAMGMVQNNASTIEFLNELRSSSKQYKLFTKEEERAFIDEYLEPMKYKDGSDVLDATDPLYLKYSMEKDEKKRKNLYYRCRRVINWKKDKEKFYHLLVMHNIRFVFNLSKKYCKNTVDYDNMIARGLFGLVKAANRFNPFAPMTKKDEKDKDNKIVIFDKDGNIIPIKFNTYAKNWIFKYIVGEFMDKTLKYIDNNSDSLSSIIKIKNNETNQTLENYVDSMISTDYVKGKTINEQIDFNETKGFYENIEDYLKTTNELTSLERDVIIDTYYNMLKIKDISEKLNKPRSMINTIKTRALKKIKKYIAKEYNIKSYQEMV